MISDFRPRSYEEWLELYGLVDTPERRALWFRRYERPAPPEGLLTSYADITRKSRSK